MKRASRQTYVSKSKIERYREAKNKQEISPLDPIKEEQELDSLMDPVEKEEAKMEQVDEEDSDDSAEEINDDDLFGEF